MALAAVLVPAAVAAGDGLLGIRNVQHPGETAAGENRVHHRCLTPPRNRAADRGLEREHPWSLPKQARAADFADTVRCLVLRFNFQYEATDDPHTSGRGRMLIRGPEADSAANPTYFGDAGNLVDPPPHDSAYFDAHLRALARYWEVVSDSAITLAWDIYPPARDSVYELPHPMSYYGQCDFDSVIAGLERYFIDGIRLADTVSPEIDFGRYDAIFMFHAGSDRQNDFGPNSVGVPYTCSDLFTGFILFGDSLAVDEGANWVKTALLMPETVNQDNRATTMNAVLAHEFGHQLGLVDLYSTATFMSQLGDFALMDNNGFGTTVDFGLPVGGVYGTMPLYPCAWSRAYLGYVQVYDFREGTRIPLAAAQMVQEGIKVARIPITEKEYYLLENRIIEYDGLPTGQKQDTATGVLQGPVQVIITPQGDTVAGEFTREYDFLLPGSGMLIYHVDESVAGLDYDGDGVNNFDDNQLQWDPARRFISLVEGDGIVNFGGYYRAGWGAAADMYRDDRNRSFTPNTNPPTIDNTGNNTHIRITGITRKIDTLGASIVVRDSLMLFDVETENLVAGFPVRVGESTLPLSPIAADLNGDGTDEIIAAAGKRVVAFTTDGEGYFHKFFGTSDELFFDSAKARVHPGRPYPVPVFATAQSGQVLSAGPVAGAFGNLNDTLHIAVGYRRESDSLGRNGNVIIYRATDFDQNGLAVSAAGFATNGRGFPAALAFGDVLWVLTSEGHVYRRSSLMDSAIELGSFPMDEYHGICRAGSGLVLVGGDETHTVWHAIDSTGASNALTVDGHYRFGPVLADVDRDGVPEAAGFSAEGDAILIAVDTTVSPAALEVKAQKRTGLSVRANPAAADMDDDGYPDLVVGGVNQVAAFDRQLTLLADFPKELDDRFPEAEVIAAPVVGDIQRGGRPEVIAPTEPGNIYAYGDRAATGFPLSAGEFCIGSPLVVHDSLGGKLGYLGLDGWFYLWHTNLDSVRNYWPMAGADPAGSFALDGSKLGEPRQYAAGFDGKRFYNYPNPVTEGRTTIRYFLGRAARSVGLTIYDLSGTEVAALQGPTAGGVDNELEWVCGKVTPGVYRCRIEVDFGGETETAFTDIAVLK